MKRIDNLIDEALDAEERALLKSIGEEPDYFRQAIDVFRGRLGWISMVLMVAQGVGVLVGAWSAWNFFAATDALAALRWGLPATVLILASLILKMALWPSIQTNRILRELKRIELQIARKP